MRIFLNPGAGGGTSLRKWNALHAAFGDRFGFADTFLLDGEGSFERGVREALQTGETDFVAAGGDGTVHKLLNVLLKIATPQQLPALRIGAVGLGSSNDFQKPFQRRSMFGDISCKVDFTSAKLRDIGCLTFRADGRLDTVYFLSNASMGVTAEANALFNTSNGIPGFLKCTHTSLAILYSAFRTMLLHQNYETGISPMENPGSPVNLTNLAIIKNPHVSGSLRYGSEAFYDDGMLRCYLSSGMGRRELFQLFRSLSHGIFPRTPKTSAWKTERLSVSAKTPFTVECDGETFKASFVHFSLLKQHIRVCQW